MTVLAGACVVLFAGVSLVAQRSRGAAAQGPTLQSAIAALNVTAVRTLKFTASGRSFVLGQPPTATEPWPARIVKSYTAEIEYVTNSMRIEQVLTMPTPAPRGGGVAINGEQRQIQYVRGAFAWNETQPAGGGAPTFQSQPAASAERVLWLWAATPQGALKAAGATLAKPVADGAQIELTVGGRYPLHVHINKLNQVDRVRAWMPATKPGARTSAAWARPKVPTTRDGASSRTSPPSSRISGRSDWCSPASHSARACRSCSPSA
jgi:hypothetical protein